MNSPKHVAIIMDGNGRWGLKNKKSRNLGHRAGLKTVENIYYNFDFINFPSNINYANLKYRNYSLSILDYGNLEDQIDNNTINTFNAYELKLDYHFKKYLSKILFKYYIGIVYIQI